MLTVDLDRLDIGPGMRLLDLGCGEGRHAHGACFGHDVFCVGLDLDRNSLVTARTGLGEIAKANTAIARRLSVLQGHGQWLPFRDDAFDVVSCSELLAHIPYYVPVLPEIVRVLKPNGRLAVSVPRAWPERICWRLSPGYRNSPGGHVRIFDASALEAEVERQGLHCVRRHGAHALHAPFWWLKCAFWNRREDHWLVRAYHRFLVWEMTARPRLVGMLEACANPVMGKSVVFYFQKEARR